MPTACETPPDITVPDEVPKAAVELLPVVRVEPDWSVMLAPVQNDIRAVGPQIPVPRVVAASVAPDAPVPPKLKEELDCVIPDVAVTWSAALFSIRSSPAPPEMPVASVTEPDAEAAPEEPKATVAPARLVRHDDAVSDTSPPLRMKSDPSPPEIPVNGRSPPTGPRCHRCRQN